MPQRSRKIPLTAEVCLLIRTHALPALSYVVPEHLRDELRVGSVVVAPLSSGSHPGVVIALGGSVGDGRATQDLISVSDDLALTEEMVEISERISDETSVALASVFRAALPPKMLTNLYRILKPRESWEWSAGSLIERRVLRDRLGDSGLRGAVEAGRIEHVVSGPTIPTAEWAVATDSSPDFGRATRQRELYERIVQLGGEATVEELVGSETASRNSVRALLRSLVERGAIALEDRESVQSIRDATGTQPSTAELSSAELDDGVRRALSGGVRIWRVPTSRTSEAVVGLTRAVNDSGRSVLVLVPETSWAGDLARDLRKSLPAGRRVGLYHSRIENDRAGVWKAASDGEIDVLVGTRSAALIPLKDLGAICVVDEPNPSHRASPGHEGLQTHIREVARIRSEVQNFPTVLLSPRPSLGTYAPVLDETLSASSPRLVSEVPPLPDDGWPAVRMVDMRGTGSGLSSTLLETCENFLDARKRVAVVANRLGHTAIVCGGCGGVRSCPDCDVPFVLRENKGENGLLVCGRCGYTEDFTANCPECGSMRYSRVRPSVDSIRRDLQRELRVPVGLRTATKRRRPGARIVAGTTSLLGGGRETYDLVVLPDADSLLLASWMGSTERAFAGIFSAAESAREMLLVQTSSPENHTLRSAVRGDFRAFAAAELPRLRQLGYPPYAHLASLDFDGRRSAVLGAVKSHLLPHIEPNTVPSGVVAGSDGGYRMLLRSTDRAAMTRTVNRAARAFARLPGRGPNRVRVTIELDPEEV